MGVSRGLCHSHYQTALTLVREGYKTWEELIAAGKATDSNRHRIRAFFLAEPAAAEG